MKLNIYFIHASGLKERERVISELQKQVQRYHFKNVKQVKIKTITEYEPQDIHGEVIQRSVNYTHFKQEDETKENTKQYVHYNQFIKNMHLFQLSNALKHYKALEYIANSSDNDINIVLEDDVVYEEKVCLLLDRLMTNLPSDYDMIFLGLPGNKEIKNKNQIQYQSLSEVFKMLPYTDSYLISKQAAKKLYDDFLPIKFVGNIHFSYMLEKHNLKPLICLPNIFIDGSKYGMFLSVLNPNNVLMFNNDYMRVRGIVQKEDDLTKTEIESIEDMIKKSPVQSHPDFMYLKAQFLQKQKKYKEAEAVYETAINIYTSNNCIVNHESIFLKDYIKLYRYLQV